MLKEKYILVEYDDDGYGATVYTMALMTEKEWSIIEIKELVTEN